MNDANKLRVFDFDDTLCKSDSKVVLKKGDGRTIEMTPGEFATYVQLPGDNLDFGEFEKLINPRVIPWVVRILGNVYRKRGGQGLAICTARSPVVVPAIKGFLEKQGFYNIEIACVHGSDPLLKVNWMAAQISARSLGVLEFFDDSGKNVQAVQQVLPKRFPTVKVIVHHIVSRVEY